MKKISMLIVWSLVFLLLMGCTADEKAAETSAPETRQSAPAETPEITPAPGTQDMAIDAYNKILGSFGGLLPHEEGYPGYDDEFADAYFDSGYLYVCVTENTGEVRDKYRAMVDEPQILQFVEVKHSCNDLYALQMAIEPPEGIGVSSWGINVYTNCVQIGIHDMAQEEEARRLIAESLPEDIVNRFSELPIEFVQEDPVMLECE